MKKLITLIIVQALFTLGFLSVSNAQTIKKKQILLIGTFHFNNPGADAVQTNDFDIRTAKAQQELAQISNQIKKFNPNKIFVEWEYYDQKKLDSLYQLYLNNQYENYVEKTYKNKGAYAMYANNEIFQLAFRAAKKTGLKQVNGIDYPLPMPFDTVMNAIKAAKQDDVMAEISAYTTTMGKEANLKRKTMGLTSLILDLNTEQARKINSGFYIKTLNRAGKTDNFGGAFSVAEWYKRNLYMYSLVQKQMQSAAQKAVILLGAGHIAIIKKFIEDDGQYEVVELKDIMKIK
ncbi:DUF5694 domain-containing protein [Pedobacter sp. Hv1]|uniref:DUF5694 domain-containing protein n=1 Tax=Pedobacter sp. Hv1 TaxID=1740090 RepID=UPI0006D8D3B3|nr:DUF5694 domain-containing protein [Pedobacter sp. Hv1]KQC02254.1 hypothetical protein AQF98_01370 [Pedobacter sp. Hv1]